MVASLLLVTATTVTTPLDDTPLDDIEPMCLLESLSFTNGQPDEGGEHSAPERAWEL